MHFVTFGSKAASGATQRWFEKRLEGDSDATSTSAQSCTKITWGEHSGRAGQLQPHRRLFQEDIQELQARNGADASCSQGQTTADTTSGHKTAVTASGANEQGIKDRSRDKQGRNEWSRADEWGCDESVKGQRAGAKRTVKGRPRMRQAVQDQRKQADEQLKTFMPARQGRDERANNQVKTFTLCQSMCQRGRILESCGRNTSDVGKVLKTSASLQSSWTGLGVDKICLASTEDEHLAFSRLGMTDTVTSSNLLDCTVARRNLRAKFRQHMTQCSKSWSCVYFYLYCDTNLFGGSSRFPPYATVCIFILFCVSWFVSPYYHVVIFNLENVPLDWAWQLREKWCGAPRADVSVSKCHETLYEGGWRRTQRRSHSGLSGKKTPSKGLWRVQTSVFWSNVSHVSPYTLNADNPCNTTALVSLRYTELIQRRAKQNDSRHSDLWNKLPTARAGEGSRGTYVGTDKFTTVECEEDESGEEGGQRVC